MTDLIEQLILDNDIEGVRAMLTGNQYQTLPVHLAKTEEMVKLLVHFGADVYQYIGEGKIALDEMVKSFRINHFLKEASEEMPLVVKRMLEDSQRSIAEGKPRATIVLKDYLTGPLDLYTYRHMVFNGLLPLIPRSFRGNQNEALIFLEHLFFRRYNVTTLRYWTGFTPKDVLGQIERAVYYSVHLLKENAEKNTDSLGLLLFFPEMLYLNSRRPITTMEMFRVVHSGVIKTIPGADNFFPVTRYASGMSRGLFHTRKSTRQYCGTFYYHEPDSNTFVKYSKALTAFDKAEAAHKLGQPTDDLSQFWVLFPLERDNMMLTVDEYEKYYFEDQGEHTDEWEEEFENNEDLQKDRQYYVAHREDVYARQDELDQVICEEAQKQGYDVIFLTNMVGSRQIVGEVLDVRPRVISFENLFFLEQ